MNVGRRAAQAVKHDLQHTFLLLGIRMLALALVVVLLVIRRPRPKPNVTLVDLEDEEVPLAA